MPSLDLTINERYRLTRKLGEGGMGEVYLAEDPVMQRQVALKFIRGPLGDPESYARLLERFQREARALAKLSHPNIERLFDYGVHEGRPYLVKEYIPGGSLEERLGTPLSWQESCRLIAVVANAIAYAHCEGVLHREISPRNILFTKTGEPVVSNFGLANVMDPGSGGEGSYSSSYSYMGGAPITGTPEYMAPEQWGGKTTEQSDIYSLGIVFFQMLTGQVPYPGKTPGEVLASLATHPVPQPRTYNPQIPPALEEIIQHALALDPQARYKSMTEFQDNLARLEKDRLNPQPVVEIPRVKPVKHVPDQETPPAIPTPKSSPGTAKWFVYLMIGIAGLTFFILGIVNGWFRAAVPAATVAPTRIISIATSRPLPTETKAPTHTPISPTPTQGLSIKTRVEKDGMQMVFIPGGTFTMGDTVEEANAECRSLRNDCQNDFWDEAPPHEVTMSEFWIDQTEVTNAMYAKCVKEGACTPPQKYRSSTRDSYYGNSTFANYPVVFVDWKQANTYCQWVGKQLPTEAQWEYAARGTDGRTYPWGNDPPSCQLANYSQSNGVDCVGDTWEVGTHPAGMSPFGVYDMAGNAWEWVADWYGKYSSETATDPTGPSTGEKRVLRSGSWFGNVSRIRTVNRGTDDPLITYFSYGFRCAMKDESAP